MKSFYRFYRLAAWLLSALILLGAAAGCAAKPSDASAGTDAPEGAPVSADSEPPQTETAPTGRAACRDNLPDDLDFDGAAVHLYFRDTIERYSVYGTDNEGDIVTDAIWDRNVRVQERLHVAFDYIRSISSTIGDVTAAIRQAAAAGLNEWDIILTTNNSSVTQGMDNIMLDLRALPHLDLDQPYWWQDAMDNVSLTGDARRYLIGDFMLLNYLRTGAFYYNKNLYENVYGDAEEPYGYVLDGSWTYDRMLERAQGAYKDANGNGKTDVEDTVGYVIASTYEEQMCQVAEAFAITTYSRAEDGSVELDMGNEHIFDVSERLYDMASRPCALISGSKISEAAAVFTEGHVLFFPGRFDSITGSGFREMEDDYGILPYPKYDGNQREYVTLCHNSSACACVLSTLGKDRYALTGAVLEALGAESYRSVTDLFLETALKFKYSRDAASGQVIDIILASIHKDLVHEFPSYTSDIFNVLTKNAPAKDGAYISAYKKLGTAAQANLNKATKAIRDGN